VTIGGAAFGCLASLGCSARGEPGTSVGAEWSWKIVTEETKGDYRNVVSPLWCARVLRTPRAWARPWVESEMFVNCCRFDE